MIDFAKCLGVRRFHAVFVVATALLLTSCATPAKVSSPPPLAVETFQTAWQIIHDTHFDANFSGVNWNAARTNFLPKIKQARTDDEVRDTIQEMLDLLGHSHLMILPGSPAYPATDAARSSAPKKSDSPTGGIGIDIRAISNQIVVFRVDPKSPAALAGLRPGDVIQKIDGEPAIDPTIAEVNKRPRAFLLWHHAADLLKGPIDEPCELTLADRKRVSVPRTLESGETFKLGNLPLLLTRVSTNQITTAARKHVGYIRFNYWMVPAIPHIDRFIGEYRNADGIIFDLRGNLGGIGGMVMGTAGHLLNRRASLGTMKMRENELRFNVFPRTVDLQSRPTNTFRGKLAILTDPITLSSAELFAGGLQEIGRARVFGERTGGQALPAIAERLPNGDLLYHAVADFHTPKGRRLETNGVEPDELIPLRIEALRAGRDEPLEAALRWMDSPLE